MAVVSSAQAGRRAAGRATILQLRAPGLATRLLELEASRLVGAVEIPVVVSARCDVAVTCGAAGVNLPEGDIPTRDARVLLGERIVGRSVHSLESATLAEREGADYVIFGPVWRSASHPDAQPVGLRELARVAAAVGIPVLAIGGVTQERIAECAASGAAGYAAIGLFA
jgi:thiamine-phosphate pyrophosphorylase